MSLLRKPQKEKLFEELDIFLSFKLIKKYIVSGSYMFAELNIISVKDIKKYLNQKIEI